MRVTNQFLFDSFKSNNNKVLNKLNTLNEQISSGQKIQNSYEDSSVYTDILRFGSQENELTGIKERSVQARSLANASDSVLNEFTETLRDFNTKLILAGNGTLNSDNLEAIATELEEQKKHMISLANTEFNGQYLFSGTATNIKPIDNEGNYHGNGDALMTLVGDGSKIQHNVDGKSLFLGDDLKIHKTLQTNIQLKNQISDEPLSANSTIRDMIGDNDTTQANDASVHFFISGTKRDGTAFKDVIAVDTNVKIGDLLDKIRDSFDKDVKVELNKMGNIQITDNKSGYSQVDFKMVGVQNMTGNISDLSSVTGDKIISFSKSDYTSIGGVDESLQMDKQYFSKNGGKLEGNVALIADGSFATASTKLKDIMSSDPMPDKVFEMKVTDINGVSKDIELNLSANSTFKVNGVEYDIYNASGDPVIQKSSADEVTMGQLNNIIAMTVADTLPASNPGTIAEINRAIKEAKQLVDVKINQNGHLQINDKSDNLSKIAFAMYDKDANDFSKTSTPSISFMSNNAVTTAQSHLSFFDELDSIINAVRNGISDMDEQAQTPRSIGIRNAIEKLNQINGHFNTAQSQIGIRSKSLEVAEQKAAALEVNVKQLKAESTEVDMAETIMKLNATTLSYQAMLQTITKVNSLSLLNYMK